MSYCSGKTDEAKGYLKQAIAANLIMVMRTGNWEILLEKDNDREKAISEYKLAITVQPSGAHFYENLALARKTKGTKRVQSMF